MKNFIIGVALLASAAPALAQSITGTGQPNTNSALAGGTIVDFTSVVDGNAAVRVFSDVTITGTSSVSGTFANQFNTFGRYLHNDRGNTSTLVFTFVNAVSAFGFNLGAADSNWTLFAGGQTYTFTPTASGNAGNYYGIAGSNITSAVATFAANDYVLIDNITTVRDVTTAVPEPATWAMMLVGFGGMGLALRRRRRPTAVARVA